MLLTKDQLAFHLQALPPEWTLRRPKPVLRRLYDFIGAPLRLLALPDAASERLGFTSLRAERMAAVLPELRGRVLDVGAGDNLLLKLYRHYAVELRVDPAAAEASVGVDVHDWGGGCTIVTSSATLPFPEKSFDTVCFIACLNHIPERQEALCEARRLLRPGGRVVVTMISRLIGTIGHGLWWYSEDKHREIHAEEDMGLDRGEVVAMLDKARLKLARVSTFVYGLNTLYVAHCE
jgi:SAM-dependent methyltransferase